MSKPVCAVGLVLVTLGASTARAQTITAFKSGEITTGMTKQCSYSALGNEYTLTVKALDLCPLTAQVRQPLSQQTVQPKHAREPMTPPPATVTAFKRGEQTTGVTKQCYYDALGSTYTKTVNFVTLCPLSLQVRTGRE